MPCRNPFIIGLFDNFASGRFTTVNTDTNILQGFFIGLVDGVAILSQVNVFSSTTGNFIFGPVPLMRIPIRNINYVS